MNTKKINETNMYKLSVKQWSPFKGCKFECSFCKKSFQLQAKRQKRRCPECGDFIPHTHPERLDHSLPNTKYMQFIFACASSDITFCPTDYLEEIAAVMKKNSNKNFLIQSKDPATFNRVKWSKNVILGTTIETNDDEIYKGISSAPSPSQRYADFTKIEHPLKMVTIEPVIDFDLDILLKWMQDIKPCMIWLGYDTKNCNLPEPSVSKVKKLHWELSKAGFVVILKKIKKEEENEYCYRKF